ncbi:MAG: Alw26I/Eco31I/Esp3I family type II restriction adenine-specific DNA-methyltransferase [Verrucomicrobia bacterium]|nr:Alw26I/Eco31I/Esp3I family type II restriction adenine-specific DNA-methyltransferase [Verrucomicrobiota bacterium]
MQHVEHLAPHGERLVGGKTLLARATGRFYTPEILAEQLAHALIESAADFSGREVRIIDPFCGDGRLLVSFLRQAANCRSFRKARFQVSLWDTDKEAVVEAEAKIRALAGAKKIAVKVDACAHDTFLNSTEALGTYDIALTNPPWEALKPDRRELDQMDADARIAFEKTLRAYDTKLAKLLPNSQPEAKYSGWGTNLSRCGLELSVLLLKPDRLCGIVLPSSIFCDQASTRLRRWLFHEATPLQVFHYPAEAKLFEQVDQPCASAVFRRVQDCAFAPMISRFSASRKLLSEHRFAISEQDLLRLGHAIPLDLAEDELRFLLRLHPFPELEHYTTDEPDGLWMGRELDETGYKSFVGPKGNIPFVKGRNISRFSAPSDFEDFMKDGARAIPQSAFHARIVWRDVSRRSQIRRMIATLLPAGCVTGNSLQVAYFKDDDLDRLHALLGIVNSLPFEFQLRSKLGTGHVSLGTVRKIRVPQLENREVVQSLAGWTRRVLAQEAGAEAKLEIAVAHAFDLGSDDYEMLLAHFDRLSESFREQLLKDYSGGNGPSRLVNGAANSSPARSQPGLAGLAATIPNHYTAKLSKLDLDVARAVPPGGNWKNIPHQIPSKRLEQIRVSFAAGEGSRSTYYGRLHQDRPSYTINTYFNRPGNGCHLHYDYEGGQHRVISEREAARLQSFPDNFVFLGSHVAVHKQIGNAVPPLLAYQIAKTLPVTGQYVDLFSGAGGLSLGFKWAGWQPIVANDIESSFLDTYQHNIHPTVVCGDIRENHIFRKIVEAIVKSRNRDVPLLVIGGPPCQGFSTAGHRRSLNDKRNHLFNDFKALVETIKPDGFVFENVTGLLNMDGGAVFDMIRKELQILDNPLVPWILNAEQFAVPQRRTRLVLLSVPKRWKAVAPPAQITSMEQEMTLFGQTAKAVSVRDALSDLPPLHHGEDGSYGDYISTPQHPYQSFMRGVISVEEYLEAMRAGALTRAVRA